LQLFFEKFLSIDNLKELSKIEPNSLMRHIQMKPGALNLHPPNVHSNREHEKKNIAQKSIFKLRCLSRNFPSYKQQQNTKSKQISEHFIRLRFLSSLPQNISFHKRVKKSF
jgi:hypothetical protein